MNLPRLELTEDPNKNNDFIIFRHTSKGKYTSKGKKSKKTKQRESTRKKRVYKKKHGNRKSKKGFFNIF